MIAMRAKPASAMQAYVEEVEDQIDTLRDGSPALAARLQDALDQYRDNASLTIGMYIKDEAFILPRDSANRTAFLKVLAPIAKYHLLSCETDEKEVRLVRRNTT